MLCGNVCRDMGVNFAPPHDPQPMFVLPISIAKGTAYSCCQYYNMGNLKRKRKRLRPRVPEHERGEGSPPRKEYEWLNSRTPKPGMPPDPTMSEFPEQYLAKTQAWLKTNCEGV